jgi:hypothetical protein
MSPFTAPLLTALLGVSAPAPAHDYPDDPDKALAQFEKEAKAIQKKAQLALEARRKQLLEHLKKLHAARLKAGQRDEATALREQVRILETAGPDAFTTPAVTLAALKKASVAGKYRHLLRVVPAPADRQSYTDFADYGPYAGTSYAGYDDIPPGHWVYVYPHWYIWRDGPGK